MVLGAGLVLPLTGVALGQESGARAAGVSGRASKASGQMAEVSYQMVREGLAVPRFKIVVREDGSGRYSGEEVVGEAVGGEEPATKSHVEREISIGATTTAKIFKAARAERMFNIACASRAKNIADTGAKMLSYSGPDGKGACEYNYSENKDVVMLTDLFLGIGTTIEEGRKLEFKRRFDHLGLDAELDTLTQSNEAGRAVELGTIVPVLRELAGDTELMQRVRLRAAKLLDRASEGK